MSNAGAAVRRHGALCLTLSQRLILLGLISVIPATLALGFSVYELRRSRLAELEAQAGRSAQLVSSEMNQIMEGVQGVLRAIALAPTVRRDAPGCSDYLDRVHEQVPQVTGIVVLDRNGLPQCRSGDEGNASSLADRPYFQTVIREARFAVGTFVIGRSSGKPSVPLASPVFDMDDAIAGVVVAGLDLEWLGHRIRERGVVRGDAVTIADRDGVIIARHPYGERFVGSRIPDEYQRLVHAAAAGTEAVLSQDGTRRMIGYIPAPLSPSGFYISAGTGSSEAMALIDTATQWSAVLLGLGALATLTLAWWFGRTYISRPVVEIVRVAQAWRAGRLDARTGMDERHGEIEAVGHAFDRLAEDLAYKQQEHDAAERQRELLVSELNHRVKNLLATVQSIAMLSFRDGHGPAALTAFQSRLAALAAGNDLLAKQQWEHADIGQVVRAAIFPLASADAGRFDVAGPPVLLPPTQVMSISLVLHELGTNAVKYGALRGETGRVSISWRTETHPAGVNLRLDWREAGGPPVAVPTRRGFGSRLIDAMTRGSGGDAQMFFEPTGFTCFLRTRIAFTGHDDTGLQGAKDTAETAGG